MARRCDQLVAYDDAVTRATSQGIGVNVVEDTLAIWIDIPVQTSRHVFHFSTSDLTIEQVQVRPSKCQFPGPDPAGLRYALEGLHSIDRP